MKGRSTQMPSKCSRCDAELVLNYCPNSRCTATSELLFGPFAGKIQQYPQNPWPENAGLKPPESSGRERTWVSSPEETVNHPAHYNSLGAKCACGQHIECIAVAEQLGFNIGNAVKYLWRAELKGYAGDDLRKAVWYINREIERLFGKAGEG